MIKRAAGRLLKKIIEISSVVLVAYYEPESRKVFTLLRKIKKDSGMLLSYIEAYQVSRLAKMASRISGEMAEVGCYRGGSAKVICEFNNGKPLHLFDTFEGLPNLSDEDNKKQFKKGDYPADLSDVKKYLKDNSNVYFYAGLFPANTKPVNDKKFCFVHLDVDIFDSTVNCLDFFYPRMSRGGIILSHDYPSSLGVKRAIDIFFRDKPEAVISLPGCNQCLIVKI